jgi:PAS domain S-box-containing protein
VEPFRRRETRKVNPDPRDWLAAIIEGSDDAIISKDLRGTITTWNPGAVRLFGYQADEVIGKPITILIPPERLDEEPAILAEIGRGNRVDHFETIRIRKDGSAVDLSLTISPIHNRRGEIVGASKIARDITQLRLAQDRQRLLMGEMHHRVKNLFAVASGIVSMSARSGVSTEEIVRVIQARLGALSRAHELIMPRLQDDGTEQQSTDLLALLRTILQPYYDPERVEIEGASPPVRGAALTNFALLLHELATNAVKYGCLSVPTGRLHVNVLETPGEIRLLWSETGGPPLPDDMIAGFGNHLEQGLAPALQASIERAWTSAGLVLSIRLPRGNLAQ